MNKYQALHEFWSSFDLPAYDETTVPDDAEMPYITYEAIFSDIDEPVMLTASLWYHSPSWEEITNKSDEISEHIGYGGAGITYNGGRLWITKSDAFAQRMADESDDMIRRIVIQVVAEFQ